MRRDAPISYMTCNKELVHHVHPIHLPSSLQDNLCSILHAAVSLHLFYGTSHRLMAGESTTIK